MAVTLRRSRGAPSQLDRAKARASAAWHSHWVGAHLHSVSFDRSRSRDGSDYNLHYVDVDAPPAAQGELAAGYRAIAAAASEAEVEQVLASLIRMTPR